MAFVTVGGFEAEVEERYLRVRPGSWGIERDSMAKVP